MKKILIVGATGPIGLGRYVCKELFTINNSTEPFSYDIKVLIRESAENDPDKKYYLDDLKSCNVTSCRGDLKDPKSLLKICTAIDVVITSATVTSTRQAGDTPESVDRQGQLGLLHAAIKCGVKKFIYISYSDNNKINANCKLTEAKIAVETALMSSQIDYTILKPTYFSECWLTPRFGFNINTRTAALYDEGNAKISWVSIRNVAQFAVSAIENVKLSNCAFNLGGPDAMSLRDIVRYCEQKLEVQFELLNTSLEVLVDNLNNANSRGNSLEQSLAALTLGFSKNDIIDMAELLKLAPEIKLTPVQTIIDAQLLANEITAESL